MGGIDDFDSILYSDDQGIYPATPKPPRPPRWNWGVASFAAVLGGGGVLIGSLVWGGFARTPDQNLPAFAPASEPTASKSPLGASPPQQDGAQEQLIAEVDPQWVEALSVQTGIPVRPLAAYAASSIRVAAEYPGCGLGWNTLAGIGHVESEHGKINGSHIDGAGNASPAILGIPLTGHSTDSIPDTDKGLLDGDLVWDRAVGPMQFIPATWNEWGTDANGDGVQDPQNIDDSALAAARYLCHIGGNLTEPDRWIAAIAAYNNTIEYNNRVAESAGYYAKFG